MERYNPGIGISAGVMMVKWDILNQHVHMASLKLKPGDEINIFINFESVLENLSMQKNLNDLVNFHKQKLVLELESAILNLVANYRMYFKKEKCIPKLYLYHTSLKSKQKQQMSVYNKYYRSYYKNRYTQNPQFRQMGKLLNDVILPEVKLIMSYIHGCYFIESSNFDGSIIPKVISTFSGSKNVIISADSFDTLYFFDPNFMTLYLRGKYSKRRLLSDIDSTVMAMIKDENPFDISIFNSELYYKLLLSIRGSKIRNISSSRGFGYGRFMNIIKKGLEEDVVLKGFESIDSILELFPMKHREDIKNGFQCIDIDTQLSLLSEVDIEGIKSQIVDKADIESLESLNNRRFLEFPINLQGLLE